MVRHQAGWIPALCLLVELVVGIAVTDNSPCAKTCGGSYTYPSDLVCPDSSFNGTTQGQKLRDCLQCEANSTTYSSETDNDLYWFLFNVKFTAQRCLFPDSGSSPSLSACESTCSPLKSVFQASWYTDGKATAHQYGYCTKYGSVFTQYASACAKCLMGVENYTVLGKMVRIMNTECHNKPNATQGQTIPAPNLFKAAKAAATTTTTASTSFPTATSTGTDTSAPSSGDSSSGLSQGAKAGIGVGCAVGGLFLIGIIWLLFRRRQKGNDTGSEETIVAEENMVSIGSQAEELSADSGKFEIGGTEVAELPAHNDPR